MEVSSQSSVMIVDCPPTHRDAFGADLFSWQQLLSFKPGSLPTYILAVVFDQEREDTLLWQDLQRIKTLSPFIQILLISPWRSASFLMKARNQGLLRGFLVNDAEPYYGNTLRDFLNEQTLKTQRAVIADLYDEQNLKLERLNRDLEERVEKRQKYLIASQKKLRQQKESTSLLHRALLSIFRGDSVAQIERYLHEVLQHPLNLDWVLIRFSDQSFLSLQRSPNTVEDPTMLALPLRSHAGNSGSWMLKKKMGSFTSQEKEFLYELNDILSLAISRIVKIQNAESLKQQWESTFDAITSPLCLVDADLNILRTNKFFANEASITLGAAQLKPAVQTLLEVDNPLLERQLLGQKKIEGTKNKDGEERYFEISLHTLPLSDQDQTKYMILFKDVTQEKSMQNQMVESAKAAELGVIGSSIAHELNNPIAGTLMFLQLMLMDIPADDPLAKDILAMQDAATKCKEIIENLLSFVRKEEGEAETFDLETVLTQAARIAELQTRSQGITISLPESVTKTSIKGQSNQITQALQNLFKNALEACLEKRSSDSLYNPQIQARIEHRKGAVVLKIADNGPGISKELQSKVFNPLFTTKSSGQASGLASGLGLTLSYKILKEHGATLELSSRPGKGTTAKITFGRPDLES